MPILATMVVEYVINATQLQTGAQSVIEAVNGIAEAVSSTSETISSGFSGASSSVQSLAETVSSVDDSLASINAAADSAVSGISDVVDEMSAVASSADTAVSGVSELESELSSVAEAADTAATSMSNTGSQTNLFTNFLGGAKSGLSDFFGGIGDTVGGMIDFGVHTAQNIFWLDQMGNMAVSTAQSMLEPAENAETMQAAFTNLLGSTKAATNELQQLDTFASHTPFQTLDIDQAASQLVGFGINAKNVIPDLTAIGDALSAVGKGSTANLDGVVNIMGKLQNTGHLTAGIMTELADRGINAWALLEQQTGKTHAQLAAMIKSGLIPADQAMSDLTKGIEANPLYQGGMAKQSQTFAGVMSTVKSNFDQFLASAGSPILQNLTPLFTNIGNTLASPAFKQFGADIGQKIVNVFSDMGKFIKSLDLGKIAGDFQHLGNEMGIAAPNASQIKTALGDIGNIIRTSVTDVGNFAKGLGDMIGWLKQGSEPANAVRDALVSIGVAIAVMKIADFVSNLPGLIAGLWEWATAQGAVALETLLTAAPYLLIGALIAIVVFGIIEAIQHWGAISQWLIGVWNAVASFFEWLWGRITDIFGKVGGWFHDRWTEAYNGTINAFKGIGDWFQGVWNGLINDAKAAGTNIVKGIADAITGAIHFVGDAIGKVTQFISDHLPHSPAKIGPLMGLQDQGMEISNQVAKGMVNGVPLISSAIGNMTKPITVGLKGTGTPNTGSSSGQTITIVDQTTHIVQVDGKVLAKAAGENIVKDLRGHGLKK